MFETEAPKYWAKGISVMPVIGKKPIVLDWTRFADALPSDNEKTAWLGRYKGLGIGLIAGPQSGIVGLDIDTDDESLIAAIERVLPPSPWRRKGRRGKMLAYKWSGEKTFSLKDRDRREIVALISSGKQFVLPPSIHPDTGMPYTSNVELLDVLDQLHELPDGVDLLLQDVLSQNGVETGKASGKAVVTKWVSQGGRDIELTRIAGALSYGVVKGELSLLNAIEIMTAKIENFTEQVAGDAVSVEVGVEKLIRMLRKDVFEGRKTLPQGWDEGLSAETREKLGIADFNESTRRFAFDEIVKGFDEEISVVGRIENAVETLRVVEKTLIRIANNPDLSPVEEHAALSHISTCTGQRVVISSMRKRLGELRRGEILGETHADAADVVKKELEEFGELRYFESWFWQWSGDHWERVDEGTIKRNVIERCKNMPAVKKATDYGGVVRTLADKVRGPLKAENAPYGVNFANGFLTEDLVLKPHSPDFGTTYVFPYPYDETKKNDCPMFMQMLETYWGQHEDFEDKKRALRQAMAATVFGVAPSYQRVFCMKGASNTGKTRILKLMEALMPPGVVCEVPPEKFNEKFESTELSGKLLNIAGEISGKQKINGKVFKMVVEGGRMQGQLKGQQIFSYSPKAAHWFASNHLPVVDEPDGGFERRWLFFEFTKQIPHTEQIQDFENVIRMEEADAIMAWVVEGLVDLRKQGFYTLPASHHIICGDMMVRNDSVRFFIERLRERKQMLCGVGETQGTTQVDLLLFRYQVFCRSEGGVQPVSLMVFIERMVEQGTKRGFRAFRKEGSAVTGFQYLTLVDAKAA